MLVYLDNGATTQMDERVVKAMVPHMLTNFGNPSSGHLFGEAAKRTLGTIHIW